MEDHNSEELIQKFVEESGQDSEDNSDSEEGELIEIFDEDEDLDTLTQNSKVYVLRTSQHCRR